MNNTLKKSGIAAFICALSYSIGILIFLIVFPQVENTKDALPIFLAKPIITELWIIIIYIIFSSAMLYFSYLINQLTKITSLSFVISIIWAGMLIASGSIFLLSLSTLTNISNLNEAELLWKNSYLIHNALGGGIEFIAGVWSLCISRELFKLNLINKNIALLGYITSCIGILTVISFFRDLVIYFGLTQLLFFIGIAIALLVKSKNLNKNKLTTNLL